MLSLLALALGVTGCFKDDNFNYQFTGESGSYVSPARVESPDVRNVLLYVGGGFNTLSPYIAEDIEDISNGPLPTRNHPSDPVLVVLSRLNKDPYSKETTDLTSPALFRIYANEQGQCVKDTLRIWPEDTPASSPTLLTEALNFVYRQFPAKGYGMIISSHASGWLPALYYSKPSEYEAATWYSNAPGINLKPYQVPWRDQPEVFPDLDEDDGYPAVKSVFRDEGENVCEMDLDLLAEAIPFHLDYLLFDACLMGCVEVAYELKGKVDLVGFSQTEVLADGFDYNRLSSRLLQKNPDPISVCKDYFEQYDKQTGVNRSATISLVDTHKMDHLAEVCKTLFEAYREKIATLSGGRVQPYFQHNRHFFYDLKDILVKAGITEEEKALLDAALDECILYKAATPSFLSIKIACFSGFSMYLPSMGSTYLDNFYKSRIAWNRATSLVK